MSANETVENGTHCPPKIHFTDSERQFILVTDVGLSSVIFTMGLVLNALSILVLQRDVRRSSMSVLLMALSVFDLIFILISAPYYVVYMGLGAVVKLSDGVTLQTRLHATTGAQPLLPLLWYFGSVARTGRNWVILLVALDRYMVVQNPFYSTQRSNPQRSRIYCVAVTCTALVYNIPLLFEYKSELHQCLQLQILQPNPKRLGFVYMLLYKKIMYILFLTVGPMLVLTAFNILLIRSLLIASRIRAAITRETTRRTEETKMLVVIIAVFVTTEIPGAVWHILLDTSFDDQTWFNSYLYSIGSLLTLFNSAINFFIYCVWSRNFRRNMMYAIRRRKKPPARVIRFDSSDSDRTKHLMLQRAAAAAVAIPHHPHQHLCSSCRSNS
uniref:G_PROTEIN_RECEP_F1_2 domain-containing protein n=1 Tax=Macrostomum lignano TaxID=282301 RepID=A0A1I8J5R9_9PLAT